jgi:hypothetical protein
MLWIEALWQDVLTSLYYVHRDSYLNASDRYTGLSESFEQLQRLLKQSSRLLVSDDDISKLPFSMTTEVICLKIRSLAIYMQFYFDYFLFRITNGADAEGTNYVKSQLLNVIHRLVQLIPRLSNISDYIHYAYSNAPALQRNNTGSANEFLHFPNVRLPGLKSAANPRERDTALALLFAFGRILLNLFDQTVSFNDDLNTEIRDSAIAICRLCTSFPSQQSNTAQIQSLLVKRSLFWAGMILTESTSLQGILFPYFLTVIAHNWIKDKLHPYITNDRHSQENVSIAGEGIIEEFLQKAGTVNSFSDIWTVEAKGVSLFYYNATLAPWFFGLNLVKFDNKRFRTLEII